MNQKRGNLIVISGASGVGKSTVIAKAREVQPELGFSVSYTTRAPREGEVDGVHYHFTDREGFLERIAEGDFLEHAQYVGHHYGTSKTQVEALCAAGRDVILDIEVQGAAQVRKNAPEAITIFVIPPSLAQLEQRLRNRKTDDESVILGRLQRARVELREIEHYDYVVVNDTIDDAVHELLAILSAERCRTKRRLDLVDFWGDRN